MIVPLSKKIFIVFLACALLSPVLPAQASVPDEPTTITLDQAVHFIGTDGSDVLAEPGEYTVEATQEWLRLIPGTERRDALLIETQPGIHDVKVKTPIVISTPGTAPNEPDVHVVQFLNPDGTSLVATGTYSGISSRGLSATAQASDSNNILTVTVDRTAQFPGLEGEDVLVPAGTYAVTVGSGQFTLTEGTGTPITIETTEWSHTNELPLPAMVFLSSEEDEIPQRHLLALFYPGGKTLQAIGTDPIVTSRGTGEPTLEYVIDPALVTFEQSVHFTAPDGTPVAVHPGTYTAEATEHAIRFIPSGDSQKALLIEAREGTHDLKLDVLLALSLPGTTPKELDLNYVILLLPDGQSLEATGSYSGIQTRGLFSGIGKVTEGLKSGAGAVGNVAIGGAKAVGNVAIEGGKVAIGGAKAVGNVAIDGVVLAGKGMEWTAKTTWKGMKWGYDQLDKAAKLVFCYGLTGSIQAAKVGGKGIEFVSKLVDRVIPGAIKDQAKFMDKLTSKVNAPFQKEISKTVASLTDKLPSGPELNRIQGWMNSHTNQAKLHALFTPKRFCKGAKFDLKQLGLASIFTPSRPQGQTPITMAMVTGSYRHQPVQNNWHVGTIVREGAGFRWTNKAGASWDLTPDLANHQLLALGRDNPYAARGLNKFKLIIRQGQIVGFEFGGGTYLRVKTQQPKVVPALTVAMVSGGYRHQPVQNNWHVGTIVRDGAGFRWTNKAGASWRLIPDLPNKRLLTETDNPYYRQGHREFKLLIRQGQIAGFEFGGGTYLRETAQVQSSMGIRSRGAMGRESIYTRAWFWMGVSLTVEIPIQGLPTKHQKSGPALAGRAGLFIAGEIFNCDEDGMCSGKTGRWGFLGISAGKISSPSGSVQLLFCPNRKIDTFDQWGVGIGASLSPSEWKGGSVNGDVNWPIPFKKEKWCFAIGGGGGGNPFNAEKHPKRSKRIARPDAKPLDVAVTFDHAWNMHKTDGRPKPGGR